MIGVCVCMYVYQSKRDDPILAMRSKNQNISGLNVT